MGSSICSLGRPPNAVICRTRAFQDENDQESMKIVKKSGNKDMMSNDAQWQAWVAFTNSGGVGGGAAPPICKQNKIIEHDQMC